MQGANANKSLKTCYFHEEQETEFFFMNVNDKCVCPICISVLQSAILPKSTATFLRKEKIKELKTSLQRQQSLLPKPMKKTKAAKEASFKVVHVLTKHKMPFNIGGFVKKAMTAIAETIFTDHKSKTEILSALANVQLGANTATRRVSVESADVGKKLELDMKGANGFQFSVMNLSTPVIQPS